MGRQDALAYPVLLPAVFNLQQSHSDYQGGFLQTRWAHTSPAGQESALQFSLDRISLNYPFAGGVQTNLNVDLQTRRPTGEHNELYWGIGFQQYWDNSYCEQIVCL